MPEKELERIAENAKFVVSGYAFSATEDGNVSILNLEHPECAMVVNRSGEMLETNMDSIEQQLVLDLCARNLQFMEI